MLDFETFVAGVGPDGLNDVYEIKILVCYLLDKVKKPFSGDELNTIFQNSSTVDYFALTTAVAQLEKSGHIKRVKTEDGEGFELLDLGAETSRQLNSTLPTALRDKIIKAALNLLSARKLSKERDAVINCVSDGYIVSCAVHDIGSDLMRMDVFAPDKPSAELIRDEFLQNTQNVYKALIGMLTKNKQAVIEAAGGEDTDEAGNK